MKVVLTDQAIADLITIGRHIRKDNPVRAETFGAELKDACSRLGDIPRGFPLVPRYEHTGIRRRPYRDYSIFYQVGAAQIDVLHVLHGARDYEPILFPRD